VRAVCRASRTFDQEAGDPSLEEKAARLDAFLDKIAQ
jgi:hypothetical protein